MVGVAITRTMRTSRTTPIEALLYLILLLTVVRTRAKETLIMIIRGK